MRFNTTKYGQDINSYDIVKFLAISIMIIDHVGLFFFPQDLWWRVIGRACVPMWFFLAGYSRAKWNDKAVIGGMLILVVADMFLRSPVFPINVLMTITLVRLGHQIFLNRYLETLSGAKITNVVIACVLLYPITSLFSEYGSIAFLFSICGMLSRQGRKDELARIWFLLAGGIFCAVQAFIFGFNALQATGMSLAVAAVTYLLFQFDISYYSLKGWGFIKTPFLFIARNSLTIYVIHWLIFLSISYHYHPDLYTKFQWVRAL